MRAFRPTALSVSSVQLYLTCPAQYRRRYVDKLVTPTNPPMSFGSAFHKALEAEHKGEDSERALITAWNTHQAILDTAGAGDMPGKAHALKLLELYRARGLGGKLGEPERKFLLRLPMANIPIPVVGYIDLPIPERRRFREFKTTSGTSWTAQKIALEFQLHVYGWAYQRLYHHRPECGEYVIFGTAQPTVDVIEMPPTPEQFRVFEQAAEKVWEAVLAQRYEPCGTCEELCKPKAEKPSTGPTFTWEG